MAANNHPNRNWRTRANDAAFQWVFDRMQSPPGPLSPVDLRVLLHQAFVAGFDAGRKPQMPAKAAHD